MKLFIQHDDGKKSVIDATRESDGRCNLILSNSDSDINIDVDRVRGMLEVLIGRPLTIANQIVKNDVEINIKETIKW